MDTHSHLRRWGAVYVLLALFLATWIGQFVTTVIDLGNDAREHGQAFEMADVWPRFLNATFENWQSEWLQLVLQAVVLLGLKHVLFKADAQDMEQVQLDLAEIKEQLGIPPRDRITAAELEDVRRLRSDPEG
jgi:membrane-associated protease RseP (regulator of RpoE activity)